jgi:hypothetical protein
MSRLRRVPGTTNPGGVPGGACDLRGRASRREPLSAEAGLAVNLYKKSTARLSPDPER